MAGRYTAEDLIFLRQSPLCVKPPDLPPAEEWMGPPPESFRNNQTKPPNDRAKGSENTLLENRRPGIDRNGSRSNQNPDDIILGPPKTNFASSTSARNNKLGDLEKPFKDVESRDRSDRFNLRTRPNDSESGNDRFRSDRANSSTNYRRRGDVDQDNEGWSTVKPRKSFGHEGAERFHGRLGGAADRLTNKDDRRTRDRDDRDNGERRNRNFEQHTRDKDNEDTEVPRRNGVGRNRSEPWFKDGNEGAAAPPMSQRERIDRAKSWRDRDAEEKSHEKPSDRGNDRGFDRRWDRDREPRGERAPEWFDEPAAEKSHGHTEEDFKKFMMSMKASRGGGHTDDKPTMETTAQEPSFFELEKKVVSAPAVESGPDKFFAAYGGLDATTPSADGGKDSAKAKAAKSSRFTSFFNAAQDEARGKTEPPTPAAAAPPPPPNGLPMLLQQSDSAEKEAFAVLLQKLQRQTLAQINQPGAAPAQAAPSFLEQPIASTPNASNPSKNVISSPDHFHQYAGDRREDVRARQASQAPQDLPITRPMTQPSQQQGGPRPEQALQDLLAQRHQAPSQGSNRMEQQSSTAANNNTEFLMRLMQSARNAPEPLRTEQLLVRMPQPTKQVNVPSIPEREPEFLRERSASQRQRHGMAPPGFPNDQFHSPDGDGRPSQPTQILQRPAPPPGLDHHMHSFPPMQGGLGGAQMPPQSQQRPMIPPPPGLLGNNQRAGPPPPGQLPPGMFPPPNFPFPPPPDGMARGMQPPPGFYGGPPPPPGFMPPPGMGGFQGGPEGMAFGVGPFDGRGMPPPGGFRRG